MRKKIRFDLQATPLEERILIAARARAKRQRWPEAVDKAIFLACVIALFTAPLWWPLVTLHLSFSIWDFVAGIIVLFMVSAERIIHGDNFVRSEKELNRLAPVTLESDPEAYLHLAALIEDDPIIRRYFREVAAQGRLPVRGEFNAAKAWVAGAEHRQLQAKARTAWQIASNGN